MLDVPPARKLLADRSCWFRNRFSWPAARPSGTAPFHLEAHRATTASASPNRARSRRHLPRQVAPALRQKRQSNARRTPGTQAAPLRDVSRPNKSVLVGVPRSNAGPLYPLQVRYHAALHPDPLRPAAPSPINLRKSAVEISGRLTSRAVGAERRGRFAPSLRRCAVAHHRRAEVIVQPPAPDTTPAAQHEMIFQL